MHVSGTMILPRRTTVPPAIPREFLDGPQSLAAMQAAHRERQGRYQALRAPPALPAPTPAPEPPVALPAPILPPEPPVAPPPLIPGQRPKIYTIQRLCAQEWGVTFTDMVSARRTSKCVFPRQVAMYLAKTITLRSLPEIGRRFNRDHTTVLHAIYKMEKLEKEDEALRQRIAALSSRLFVPLDESSLANVV